MTTSNEKTQHIAEYERVDAGPTMEVAEAYADGRFDERKAIAEWLETKGLNLFAIDVMRRAHLGYDPTSGCVGEVSMDRVATEPRYERRHGGDWICLDCGCLVVEKEAHTRFHSILGSHAWSLAVLKTAHIASHIHDKYEVVERIDSKKFDNWSAEALAEVVAEMDARGGPGPHRG